MRPVCIVPRWAVTVVLGVVVLSMRGLGGVWGLLSYNTGHEAEGFGVAGVGTRTAQCGRILCWWAGGCCAVVM